MRQHLKNEVRAFCGENNLPPARFAEAKDVKPRLGCSIEGAPKWLSPHIERLGRVPDKKLANELGVSSSAIRYWRIQLGIQEIDWEAKAFELFGRMPDDKIALEVGVWLAKVRRYRESLGIPAWREQRIPVWVAKYRDRLGKEPDIVIAEELGISRERVRQVRVNLGIGLDREAHAQHLRKRNERKKMPLPDDIRKLFGVVSDSEIRRRAGVSESVQKRWRKEFNLPPPPNVRTGGRLGSKLDGFAHLFREKTYPEIARAAGVSLIRVFQYAKRNKLQHGSEIFLKARAERRLQRFSKVDENRHLFEEHHTFVEIAEILGISYATVRDWVKLHPEFARRGKPRHPKG